MKVYTADANKKGKENLCLTSGSCRWDNFFFFCKCVFSDIVTAGKSQSQTKRCTYEGMERDHNIQL